MLDRYFYLCSIFMPNQTDIQSDPMPMGSMKWYILTIDQMTFSHTLFKISSITIHFLMSYNFSFLFLQRVFCNKWASELHLHSAYTGSLFSEWEVYVPRWEGIINTYCIVNSFSSRNISFPLWKTEMCGRTSGAVLGRLLEVAAFICLTQCG